MKFLEYLNQPTIVVPTQQAAPEHHMEVFSKLVALLGEYDTDFLLEDVEPEPDPCNIYYGVRFKLGDVLASVEEDCENGLLRLAFQHKDHFAPQRSAWLPMYNADVVKQRFHTIHRAYQHALEDGRLAGRIAESVAQLGVSDTETQTQYAGFNATLTLRVTRTDLAFLAVHKDGRIVRIVFDFTRDDSALPRAQAFVAAILNKTLVVTDMYVVNSWTRLNTWWVYLTKLQAEDSVSVAIDFPNFGVENSSWKTDLEALQGVLETLQKWAIGHSVVFDVPVSTAIQQLSLEHAG